MQTVEANPSLVRMTHLVYALHALGLAIGAFGAASVLGSFLFGWPSIIAVIINYVKRSDVRGTWLESHFTLADPHLLVRLLWAVLVASGVAARFGDPGGHRHLDRRHVPARRVGHLPHRAGLAALKDRQPMPHAVESRLRRGFQSSRRGRFRPRCSLAPSDWCARPG